MNKQILFSQAGKEEYLLSFWYEYAEERKYVSKYLNC